MKKVILLFAILVSVIFSYAYEWEQIGPPNIKANKLCIINNSDNDVYAFITVDTGMYIVSDWYPSTGEFYNLPIVDACRFDFGYPTSDSVIVILNEGSYSDGIYSFHLETHELSLIEFCYKPHFVERWWNPVKFYVGYEGGLLTSDDGIIWESDTTFQNANCISISKRKYSAAPIVITDNPTNNAYVLDEDGQIWHPIVSDFNIKEAFDEYGICRDGDGDYEGLYELGFTGQTYQWSEKFNSDSLNCIGGSNTGNAFVGWHSAYEDDEGVAEVKYSFFQFKNEGLPNFNINHITSDPQIVGGEMIFCCTDDGAFRLDDTTTEIDDLESNQEFSIFPNPITSSSLLNISFPEMQEDIQIQLYNIKGNIEFETKIGNSSLSQQIQLPDVSTGVYYFHIISDTGDVVKKLVIR